MVLTIDITENQTEALSQVLKRIGFSDVRSLCVDEDEAFQAQFALDQIRKAVNKQGFNPR